MVKESLFPEDSPGIASKADLLGTKSMVVESLGGNFHQLSDQQITKIINMKFNSDPLRLIRQLSDDLASKESQLILLRQEKFKREQKLLKICNENCNLTSRELDEALNGVGKNENIDDVMKDLMNTAMEEQSDSPQQAREEVKDIWSPELFNSEITSPRDSIPEVDQNGWGSNSQGLKAFSLSLFHKPSFEKPQPKIPVELDSISLPESSPVPPPDIAIDKYGFFESSSYSDPLDVLRQHHKKPASETPLPNRSEASLVTELDVNGTTEVDNNSHSAVQLKAIGELHDMKNKQQEGEWDSFFKDINKDYNITNSQIDDPFPESKELMGFKGLNLLKLDPTSISHPEESKHYKRFLNLVNRVGIPQKYRHELWPELSGAKDLKVNGEYQRYCHLSSSPSDQIIKANTDQIDLDLHRTMPFNIHFNDLANSKPGPHFYKLKKILYAFTAYSPTVGYSQGMNKIVGNLLLSARFGEEDIFWIFVAFIHEILPTYGPGNLYYFSKDNFRYLNINQRIIANNLFPKFLPNLHRHFKALNVQVEFITIDWWLSIFTEVFPSVETWFKLFDTFLVSNTDVKLMSLSLSLFKLFEQYLIKIKDNDEIYLLMKNLNHVSLSKINFRLSDLMMISETFESRITSSELDSLRSSHVEL